MPDSLHVRTLLSKASDYDERARALRREAGRELARLRDLEPQTWREAAGIDRQTAELLIRLGAGL